MHGHKNKRAGGGGGGGGAGGGGRRELSGCHELHGCGGLTVQFR